MVGHDERQIVDTMTNVADEVTGSKSHAQPHLGLGLVGVKVRVRGEGE